MLKLYRRLRAGVQPEIEVGRFLTEVADFAQHAGLPRQRSSYVAGRGRADGARRRLRLRPQPGRRLERARSMRSTAHLDELALLPAEDAARRTRRRPSPIRSTCARSARPAHGRAARAPSRRRPTTRPSPPSRSTRGGHRRAGSTTRCARRQARLRRARSGAARRAAGAGRRGRRARCSSAAARCLERLDALRGIAPSG